MYRKWLIEGLANTDKSQRGLAAALGLDPTAISRMKQGTRKIQADELPVIAKYLGISIPPADRHSTTIMGETVEDINVVEVMMRGTLEAGHFRPIEDDIEAGLPKSVIIPMRCNAALSSYHGWLVRGDSMDRAGIIDGDFVVSLDTQDGGWQPENGQVVVVERRIDGAERERTVKRVEVHPDRVEFVPVSSNPRHKRIVVPIEATTDGGLEVEVIGRVVKVVRDI
jgi:SOS-response transcriptional repressor LexA